MKIVYLKYIDPMLWTRPEDKIYEADLEHLKLMVVRDAGILIKEDENTIILGEVHLAQDNKELADWDIEFPCYRHVSVVNKADIIHRQDWEVEEFCEKEDIQ